MGGMHPMFPVWHAREYEVAKRLEREWSSWLRDIEAPMPTFYSVAAPLAEQPLIQRELAESWKRLYGQEKLANDGYAYLTAFGMEKFPDGGPRVVSREEFRIAAKAARDIGMRRFVVWAAIDSSRTRDELQQFIDNTLAPLMREWNAK